MSGRDPVRKPTGAVLVVGAGIAGMQASLDLAEQGFRVHLVEASSAIGGHMAQLDKTFPTNDCAMCIISPKLVDTGRHLNIDLHLDSEVVAVEGEAGDFRVTLRHRPRYVDLDRCVACGDCEAVCPVSLPDPYNEGLKTRKAIYKLYPQAVPNAYAIEKAGTAPCRHACPVDQRAQGYIALIAQGRYREALRVIKEDNPFPSVCGRTCHHPCEGRCARALIDEPVSIMALKRFVVDYALAYGREPVQPAARTRPEWVAVVGAGPAGLTAAHDLAKLGYGVTVYEALPVAGGMMRVGIPAHRLPKGVLQQDIDDILALGIVLKTNTPIADPTDLLKEGYHAVCLATGISARDHSLGVEGEQAQGVISAATFLRKINLGEPIRIGARVAVVGGGITALDAAAVARRLGALEVYLALDRPRGELPAYQWEMAAVEAEGIHILEHTTLTRILSQRGHVAGVELARTAKGMTMGPRGRRRPRIQPGTEFTLAVDTVIGTTGQQSDLCFLDAHYDDLAVDRETLASEIPGLFVVGGRKTGASYIVDAIALGHRVARSIHAYLQGDTALRREPPRAPVVKLDRQAAARLLATRAKDIPRAEPALLPMEERVTSFREVVLGLTERQARAEAQRCLQCGVCAECLACVYACGPGAIDHSMQERSEELQVGAIILAPGCQPYRAELAAEYGYGRYANVITSLQLERLLSASGPTGGQVLRPSDGAPAKRIAFLQCVGSRDQDHDYCSAVCCMYATKEALLIRDHDPQAEVQVFMMDVRAFGKGYDDYYRRARHEYGIRFTRCRISSLREDPETGNILVRYVQAPPPGQPSEQGVNLCAAEEAFDLVVLSVGMEVSPQVQALARKLGVELDPAGFCATPAFQPIETSRPGIYAVGPFREPKDIPESVVDASAAAGLAGARLSAARGDLARKPSLPPERDVLSEPPRVGVFVCHCGSNIAGYLDVEAVTAYAAGLPGVVHAEHMLYACSQDSTAIIRQRIDEHKLNRVVVASCTPLTHGPLFEDVLRSAGLNPHLFAMANIRNHCSWVHSWDPRAATEKAKDLVRMALGRVLTLEPLHPIPAPVTPGALVIGGGPAGMSAALTLAEAGFPVHLVERNAELGGNLRQIHFGMPLAAQAPAPDPQALLQRLVRQVNEHARIQVHCQSELVETHGFAGNFTSLLQGPGGQRLEVHHGAILLATGGQEYRGHEYGYGQSPRVLTTSQFEALMAAPDRAAPVDLQGLRRVVMIQCVGPAERTCARTCCAVALKNALQFKALQPQAQVIILHKDLRVYGFKERLYLRALEAGILFIRRSDGEQPRVEIQESQGALTIHVREAALGAQLSLQADLLVLSTPMVPAQGSRDLAHLLKVPVDGDGWFLEAHVKLRPVDFSSNGIFLAGAAHYPKLLGEAIVQAQAAASRAATLLAKEALPTGGAVARVDPQACVGCLTCVRICPYGVPRMKPDAQGVGGVMGTAHIEPSICQGCGTCVGECPANAIELLHYQHSQLETQVRALFDLEVAGMPR
jgi:heterodisulfide reductase subunit A-like polyferredoxin